MWILLAMMSALLLGIYDVFKKKSLSDNAVIPVLSISIFFSFLLFLPLLIASVFDGAKDNLGDFYIPFVVQLIYIVKKPFHLLPPKKATLSFERVTSCQFF